MLSFLRKTQSEIRWTRIAVATCDTDFERPKEEVMTRRNIGLIAICLLTWGCTFAHSQDESAATWKPVETALGRSGQMQPGGVYKFGLPRKDLKVVKSGVSIAPGLALGSCLAFKTGASGAMVMGDLVLTEEEIEPVMLKLQQEEIEQTAIHNHLLGESPRIVYMHIEGHGDAVALANLCLLRLR